MSDRKRDGDDLLNARSSPWRWDSEAHDSALTMELARQLEQQRRASSLQDTTTGGAHQAARLSSSQQQQQLARDSNNANYASLLDDESSFYGGLRQSTRDHAAEVNRLRQEIAIQERLLNEAMEREQRLRRLQQQQSEPPSYYNDRSDPIRESNTSLAERIRRLERELELRRMANARSSLETSNPAMGTSASLLSAAGGLSIDRLHRSQQDADRAVLQRMLTLREEDSRQRLIDELRLHDSLHGGATAGSLTALSGNSSMSDGVGQQLRHRHLLSSQQHSNSLLRGSGHRDEPISAQHRNSSTTNTGSRPRKKDRPLPRQAPIQAGPSVPVEEDKIISMTLATDATTLSKYQATIRAGLEFFTANQEDALSVVQGRKKRIRLYQVGIRCKYCAKLPLKDRSTGAVYFPASLGSVYQAAQNVASVHMLAERKTKTGACPLIPKEFQKNLEDSKNMKAGSLVGKQYWADSCMELGIAEEDGGLWFPKSLNSELLKPSDNKDKSVVAATAGGEGKQEETEDTAKREENKRAELEEDDDEDSEEELGGNWKETDDDDEYDDDHEEEEKQIKVSGPASAV